MLISFVCLCLLFYAGRGKWLDAAIAATVAWTGELLLFTELLSLGGWLRFGPLLALWLLSALALLGAVWRTRAWPQAPGALLRQKSPAFWALLALFALMAVMAVLTVTYNWDSMTYHMPRICRWAQDGTVAHYSTNCKRQISSPVLAEYVMLHVYLLTGKSDLLLNLVQCVSAGGCALLTFGIAQRLGAKKPWCWFAALLTLSMPILFSEAFTTEADVYSSLWLLMFAALLLDFVTAERLQWDRPTLGRVLLLALVVGFGYVAKPNACIGMLVLTAWMAVVRLCKRDKLGQLIPLALAALPALLLPMLPGTLRNLHSFGALQSSSVSDELMVGTTEPRFLLANLVKHVCYNLSNGYIPGSSALLDRIVADFGWILGLNMNDPAISLANAQFHSPSAFSFGNDSATNPLVMLLMLCAVLWCLVRLRKGFDLGRQYTLVSFAAFCVMGVTLRWQYWGTRLLMPFFLLCIPAVALQAQDLAEALLRRKSLVLAGLLSALCCLDLAVQVGAYHAGRLALGRPAGYFAADNCIYHQDSYQQAAELILQNGWKNVGLYTGNDSYEYPLWAMLGDGVDRIEHVFGVTDPHDPPFTPDVIFSVDRDLSEGGFDRDGVWYAVIWQAEDGVALLRAQ